MLFVTVAVLCKCSVLVLEFSPVIKKFHMAKCVPVDLQPLPSSHRTVCVHSCHFSPENAQLQLMQNQQVHTFFSAARHGSRRVVALHLVPGAGEVEEGLRRGLGNCSTLRDLLLHLSRVSPSSTEIVKDLIIP